MSEIKKYSLVLGLLMLSVLANAAERGTFYVSAALNYSGHSGTAVTYATVDPCDFDCVFEDTILTRSDSMNLSSGPGYEFRVGTHLGARHLLYLSWSQFNFGEGETDVDHRLRLNSLGYRYYISPQTGSGYLGFSIGKGDINYAESDASQDNSESWGAYSLNLGYEVNQNLDLGIFYNHLSTDTDENLLLIIPVKRIGTYYDVNSYGIQIEFKLLSRQLFGGK
ncbi:outer membrane beta-barrel protein [Gynuella sp.]|uniref:outer membrane beta-barrel protein n=1 Tax=Gynuella sp. TaxID=2969146 RepID=UPI003D0E6EBA